MGGRRPEADWNPSLEWRILVGVLSGFPD